MAGGTTAPFGIDTTVPSTARMYDWWLGGHDYFAADRAAALAVSDAAPEAQLMAVENRRFLRRAVRYLVAEAGITQYLDIGTGLPTQGNVHQVAQGINPTARVVYVDNDHCKSGCAHAWQVRLPEANTVSNSRWVPEFADGRPASRQGPDQGLRSRLAAGESF